MMAHLEAICVSEKKGTVKKPVPEARFRENHGIIGDAHAGNWHRQVSLLAGESIDAVRQKIPNLSHGAFGENLITRGLEISQLQIGDRLRVGDEVLLEVTQIGKECHEPCAIMALTGDCIMPKEGVFTRVLRGGTVRTGDPVVVLTSEVGRKPLSE